MKALLDGLKALGPTRLLAMGAVALGMLALLAMLAMRGGSERMALLYGDLDLRESGQVVERLARQKIPYRVVGQGSEILVPAEQVAQARLMLAKDGLPSGGSIGYEIFDRGDGLAATEFQQKINETRALEGELARSIRVMNGVRAARVHLVLPRREPFARERQDAQASVLLTMAGGQRLDRGGVQAIVNLVAAAVPGLRAPNISVVDSRGDVLARAGEPAAGVASAASSEETRRATELRLSHAVEEMLERSLGPGRVRAEASVRMSFDRVNETQEHYDPDGQVTRSQQNVTDNSKTTEASATTSVQNNLPNADAGSGNAGSQQARQEETINYEIGRTVRTLIREQPQIERISLAVMVDGVLAPGADGKPAWQPRPEAELASITALVKSAIGFDERRGDHVEIVSMRIRERGYRAPRRTAGSVRPADRQGRPAAPGRDRPVRADCGAGAAGGAAPDGSPADHGAADADRHGGGGVGRRRPGTGGKRGGHRRVRGQSGPAAAGRRVPASAGRREHGEHRPDRGADAGLLAAADLRSRRQASGRNLVDPARLDRPRARGVRKAGA